LRGKAHWLEVDYPAIARRASKDKAIILWLDQTGLRSDAAVGTTWAPVGKTPVVGKTGKRFGVNAMAAIANTGELYSPSTPARSTAHCSWPTSNA
jgi:hypothetical protein